MNIIRLICTYWPIRSQNPTVAWCTRMSSSAIRKTSGHRTWRWTAEVNKVLEFGTTCSWNVLVLHSHLISDISRVITELLTPPTGHQKGGENVMETNQRVFQSNLMFCHLFLNMSWNMLSFVEVISGLSMSKNPSKKSYKWMITLIGMKKGHFDLFSTLSGLQSKRFNCTLLPWQQKTQENIPQYTSRRLSAVEWSSSLHQLNTYVCWRHLDEPFW